MGKVCIQCNTKIGFFKSPIEGVYCTYDCRNDARREMEDNQRKSRELEIAAKRHAEEERAESRRSEQLSQAAQAKKSACPKCSEAWSYVQGGGAMGLDVGDCIKCGFSAEFLGIERCPHCHCESLVMQSDDSAKCPRCKYRHGASQRLSA